MLKLPERTDPFDRQMEITEHLDELRTRLIRCLVYAAIGTLIAWVLYPTFYQLLMVPLKPFANREGFRLIFTGFLDGFFLQLKVSLLVGLALVSPLISFEAWRFVSPALTRTERRVFFWLIPFASFLFVSGVLMAYKILPAGIRWFLSYTPGNVQLMQHVGDYMLFLAKMCLAFGIVFQLPIVLMFLAKVGLVTSATLKKQWRYAIVLLATVAAVATPSNDPFSMLMMTIPLVGLYLLSIVLVKVVE